MTPVTGGQAPSGVSIDRPKSNKNPGRRRSRLEVFWTGSEPRAPRGDPVVVVSARDPHGNQERALKAGAKADVQKPWSDTELLAIVGQLLGKPDLSVSRPA